MTGRNNLDVCIDYLGVTFKRHDHEHLIEQIFQITPVHFYDGVKSRHGYSRILQRGELSVLLSEEPDETKGERKKKTRAQ